MGRRLYRSTVRVQDVFGSLTELLRERLAGLKIIQALNLEALTEAETLKAGQNYASVCVKASIISGAFYPFLHLMTNLAVVLIVYFGGRESIAGRVSAGDFVAFIG